METSDVLVVGAGPTGLALASELVTFGVRVRVIDAQAGRAHESRAIAVQARTLELLDRLGIASRLIERGRTSMRISVHAGARRGVPVPLLDIGAADTRFPYMLVVSQAETEGVLDAYLSARGGQVQREVTLTALEPRPGGVSCTLRRSDGSQEQVVAAYVVGCDGAHSAVRRLAGIGFHGAPYPNNFILADCAVEGIEPDGLHLFIGGRQFALLAPMARPAPWRVIATEAEPPVDGRPPGLDELQAMVRRATGRPLVLRESAWITRFRLHHRMADSFRRGRVFLAGDAAHIHSPAGGQGMNTGIQDACNLAWKLALVLRGEADQELLSSYEAERTPVARFLLDFTDRLFTLGTSDNMAPRVLRRVLVPALARLGASSRAARARLLRVVSQLGIRYRQSPAVATAAGAERLWPRAGDRLPDLELEVDGRHVHLQQLVSGRQHQLLLCGSAAEECDLGSIAGPYGGLVRLHRIPEPGRLGSGIVLVRPDGHVGFRGGAGDGAELGRYLGRWLRAGVKESV